MKAEESEAVIAREMQEQGFSQAQIAEYLGCSRSTVKRRLRR
ncbi:MAG: sigma factor-like helix-turn-helix DNA-binding protein [Candidatus Thorarchaeota archaeon]